MPDLLIPDLDEAVVERLKAVAEQQNTSLGRVVTKMLDLYDAGDPSGIDAEIAAMRASQPRQSDDAARDVRRLRDGGEEEQDATRAA